MYLLAILAGGDVKIQDVLIGKLLRVPVSLKCSGQYATQVKESELVYRSLPKNKAVHHWNLRNNRGQDRQHTAGLNAYRVESNLNEHSNGYN